MICLLLSQDLYEKAGLEGERIVFLLTDTQITHEAFLEVGLLFNLFYLPFVLKHW